MRLKSRGMVALLALVLSAPAAHAGGWMISAKGGLGIPTGDFASSDSTGLDAKSGPTVSLDVCYQLNDMFAVGVDGGWTSNKHSAEGDVEDLGGGVTLTADKDKFVSWQVGVHGKYMIPMEGSVHPYGVLGLGIYNVKEDYEYTYKDAMGTIKFTDESDNFEQPGSRFGGRVGLGAIFKATEQIGFGLEGDYNLITMDKDKFDISNLQYITVRAMVSYSIASMSN